MGDVPTSPSEEDLNNPGSPKEDEADENFFTRTTKKWPFKIDHAWAEFCAMMLFVFIGCGAASHNTDVSGRFYSQSSSLGPDWTLLVALAFGISIMVLASATLHTRRATLSSRCIQRRSIFAMRLAVVGKSTALSPLGW